MTYQIDCPKSVCIKIKNKSFMPDNRYIDAGNGFIGVHNIYVTVDVNLRRTKLIRISDFI